MDIFGLYAHNIRVSINKHKELGSYHQYGGSIGFKQRDGSWLNRWIDVMVPVVLPINNGEAIFVDGKYNESEREWQGKKYENRTIWADRVVANGVLLWSREPEQVHTPSKSAGQVKRVAAAFLAKTVRQDLNHVDEVPF